jgi:hypothetical protein
VTDKPEKKKGEGHGHNHGGGEDMGDMDEF